MYFHRVTNLRSYGSRACSPRAKKEAVEQVKSITVAPIMCAVPKAHAEAYPDVLHASGITTAVALLVRSLHREAVQKVQI